MSSDLKHEKVNVMYQTSLKQFLVQFDFALARSSKSPIAAKRIANIIEYLTLNVFLYTARGFYEQDKFLYALLLTLKIDKARGKISFEQFNTFIKGGASLDLNSVDPKPKKWILDSTWLNLVQLSRLPRLVFFRHLFRTFRHFGESIFSSSCSN